MFRTEKIVYFEEKGRKNTDKVLSLVRERAEKLGINSVVIASSSGETGIRACEALMGFNVVVVTSSVGFRGPDERSIKPENYDRIINAGGKVLTTTHAFGGIGRAIRKRFEAYQYDEIIAHTLRLFGQGTKVAIEVALMASDAGLVSVQENLISIGGSDRGADTALVLHPSHVQDFFKVKVREIICKPQL
jgi:hypothetical protein